MNNMLYGLDIETDTTTGGLDPTTSEIIAVAISTADGTLQKVLSGLSERELLTQMHSYLESLPAGVVVTWNGSSFDLAFIEARAAIHGIATGWTLSESKRPAKYTPVGGHVVRAVLGRHAHVDIAYVYQEFADQNDLTWSLKPVATELGLAPVEVDRTRTDLLSQLELDAYVASDARCTAALAAKLSPQQLAAAVD